MLYVQKFTKSIKRKQGHIQSSWFSNSSQKVIKLYGNTEQLKISSGQ
jgi:hypothetical protein